MAEYDIIEAIERRISCRAFTQQPVEQEKFEALANMIEQLNAESGLHFQLFGPDNGGTELVLEPKMFAGTPPCHAALVGPAGPIPEEQLGYYGEKLVLYAEQLGLSTCWVAGTFDRSSARAEIAEGEVLHDVVPLGYPPEKMPLKQRTIRTGLRARSKKLEDLWRGPTPLAQAPEWVRACIDAVGKAPSAINEQPVVFVQETEDAPIRAQLVRVKTGKEYTDLGIAKLHFELVVNACAGDGNWEWGDGGAFVLS